MAKKIDRSEVDGTVPGVAVLLITTMTPYSDETETYTDKFVEGEHGVEDPHLKAERLWAAVKDDYPDRSHAIVVNERARYLMTRRRMKQMIDVDYTIDQYLEQP